MAPCDDESCSEMIDFGVLPPLIDLIRERKPLLEVKNWRLYARAKRGAKESL